jgi:N-acetylglucosamine kinase-like BadF-type ATPase
MPQGPFQTVSLGNANSTALNLTAATVVKPANGFVVTVSVLVAGSAVGAVYDATSTTGNTVADQVAVIPDVVGNYVLSFPCKKGIVVAPGTGQTVAISYN